MADVQVDLAAIRAFEASVEVRADLHARAVRVRSAAARRAGEVSRRWAAAMDSEAGTDELGAYEDVSWRHGTGANEEWRGHFFLFGTVQPHHPPHLDVLLGALDEV